MLLKEKISRKVVAIVLVTLLLFNPLLAPIALAEEDLEVPPEPAPAQETQEVQGQSQEQTAPAESAPAPESTIITGDTLIVTGDATASGTIQNEVNSNEIVLEPTPTPSETAETEVAEDSITPTPIEERTLMVENNNQAEVKNEADISASTGENLASENLGDVKIMTGDALALANLLNLLNINVVGSNFEVLLADLQGEDIGNMDLNSLWEKILEKEGTDSLSLAGDSDLSGLKIVVENQNEADLENVVSVCAETGENQANGNGNSQISTGDAQALANVTNLVNINILGSKFLLAIFNILDPESGDLILPRPEKFLLEAAGSGQNGGVVFANQNDASVEDSITSLAETGQNQENNNGGDNSLQTGDAKAIANDYTLANLNIQRNDWFFLIINRLGRWSGKILGWSTPSSEEDQSAPTNVYELGSSSLNPSGGQPLGVGGGEPWLEFKNDNKAKVVNQVLASASTGGNQASENLGGAEIRTGQAQSAANVLNLVNLNVLGSRWFMGIVNIMSDWTGNTIFAYPDVSVWFSGGADKITPGGIITYALNYENQGYDKAEGVVAEFRLPEGVSYVEDSSGLAPSVSGRTYSWFVGTVEAGNGGSFVVTVRVNSDFSFEKSLSFWSRIIPQAYAAENEKEREIVFTASIRTPDPESNISNNNSSRATMVYLAVSKLEGQGGSVTDQRQPVLMVSALNNVNDYVYEGDTVTFEITVKNTGEVSSYNTRLVQELFNSVPGGFGKTEFDLGTIEPGKTGKLSFGLQLADGGLLPDGHYYTVAKVSGIAPDGQTVSSNEARTDFNIRLRVISSLSEARAIGKEGEILGSAGTVGCSKNEDILPYALLFLMSSAHIISWRRRKLAGE